jgi:hypothetical protein
VAQLFSLGGYAFMKTTFIIVLSGLLLCGCSQKQASSTVSATDSIRTGTDITFNGGSFILYVTKRDSNSLAGIRCVSNPGMKSESHFTADTGEIVPSGANSHWVVLAMHNTKDEKTGQTNGNLTIALKK